MQVSVEKTSELSRKMIVSVPEELFQEKIDARLKTLAREVKIHGFRPGKVPTHVVKKMYGDKIRDEITSDLIKDTYFKAVETESLRPVGYPHIESVDENNGFQYTAVFEVYPEISLEGLNTLAVTRPVATVEESDVDDIIEKLRVQQQQWNEVERTAQEGDRITISFAGTENGTNFTDGTVENYAVEIGAKQMIPGFEDNLIGLEKGSSKKFEVTFPEEYGNAQLAGKLVEFDVTVAKVEVSVMPEIDEAFIKTYGIEDGSVESFRNDVKANMGRELDQALKGRLKNAVMDALYQKIQVTVPATLIDEEIANLMKPYEETAKRQKMKLEDLQLPRDAFEKQAQQRVALGLILGEIISKNEIQLDDNKVRSTIEDMAKSYESPEDVVNWYYSDKNRLHDVQQMVLEDQTVEWLLSQASVTDETVTFGDVMAKQQR
ncbi:MAG: trigger factor [Methylococcaceae bacterium]